MLLLLRYENSTVTQSALPPRTAKAVWGKFEIAYLSLLCLGVLRASLLILLVWVCSSAISFPAIAWWRATASGPSPPYKVSSTRDKFILLVTDLFLLLSNRFPLQLKRLSKNDVTQIFLPFSLLTVPFAQPISTIRILGKSPLPSSA